jgi:hypothetical protein
MPTVDQILENYIKAIGGKDASMKVRAALKREP